MLGKIYLSFIDLETKKYVCIFIKFLPSGDELKKDKKTEYLFFLIIILLGGTAFILAKKNMK